jgi:hypothetical protein
MTNDWWLQTFMIIIIKVAHAVAINCSSISDSRNDLKPAVFLNQCSHVQWYCFNSSTRDFDCKHIYNDLITCTDSGPTLQTGFCATYSEYTELLSITDCPYFQLNGFNITPSEYTV